MVNKLNLWFASLYKISPALKYKIIKQMTIEELFKNGSKHLTFLTPIQKEEIENTRNEEYLKILQKDLLNAKANYIHYSDANFPSNLSLIENPPIGIFTKGLNISNNKPIVGIIGTRHPSDYGKQVAYELSYRLAPYCTIISGLAIGIDGIAHQGCIDANGYTIGVIGCGIDKIYPTTNHKLFQNMMTTGTIISEYAPGISSQKWHFPARNRIISALCDILIVVEAKIASGTSITINEALKLGKDIFAVPARINDKNSYGCLKLIKDGAYVLCSYKEILEHLNIQEKPNSEKSSHELLYEFLSTEKSTAEIQQFTGLNYNELVKFLLDLEIKGIIKQTTPNMFTIV